MGTLTTPCCGGSSKIGYSGFSVKKYSRRDAARQGPQEKVRISRAKAQSPPSSDK
jgi:hypothetical protein